MGQMAAARILDGNVQLHSMQSTKESKNFHLHIQPRPDQRGARPDDSFSIFFTRSMKVARFFCLPFIFNPFYKLAAFFFVQSIKQHVCSCARIIWKCAIAHRREATTWFAFPFQRAGLELTLFVFFVLSLHDQITQFPIIFSTHSTGSKRMKGVIKLSASPFTSSFHQHFLFA